MTQFKFELFEGPLPQSILAEITRLNADVFGLNETEHGLAAFLPVKIKNGQLVGYKIGFAVTDERFESWRGAIAVEARRKVAAELMRLQHAHCLTTDFVVLRRSQTPTIDRC